MLRSLHGMVYIANKHRFITTNPTHINFYHGVHACIGRVFAANEIKLLPAYVLLYYEVRIEADEFSQPTRYDRSRRPNIQA